MRAKFGEKSVFDNAHAGKPGDQLVIRYQLLLGIFYFLVVTLWSVGIGFHGAPDEATHFFLLEYLKTFHSLPGATEPSQLFIGPISGWPWHPGAFWYHGLPFPHVLGALVTSYSFGWLLPDDLGYLAVRSFNWLLGPVFICALFRIAHRSGMQKKSAAMAALLIALIPQVSFVFSYFNSDAYGLTSIALTLSALLGFSKAPGRLTAIYLGASLGLLILAKLYFLPALVFVAIMFFAYQHLGNRRPTEHLSTVAIVALIIAAPMLVVTYLKFGEITGISGQLEFVAMHKSNPGLGFGTCYIGCADHFFNTETIWPWLSLATKSYFSVTGWMDTYLPPPYYMGAALLLIVFVVGAIFQTVRLYTPDSKKHFVLNNVLPLVMVLGLFPSIIFFSILGSQNALPQPQGRYLFVTIPFLAILIAIATTRHASAQNSASIARAVKSNSFHLKFLLIVVVWMTWTNMLAWSLNTLHPTNIQKSAIGRPVIEAIQDTPALGALNGVTLDGKQLAKLLFIDHGEFLLKTPFNQPVASGNIDILRPTKDGWIIGGWTFIEQTDGMPQYVVAVEAGKVVGAIKIDRKRPDVAAALANKKALRSGYEGSIVASSSAEKCDLKLYTLTSNFKIFAMSDACEPISRLSH